MSSPLDPHRLRAAASRDRLCDTPQHRLHRLLAVPGSEPYRVNDLLLLRPEAQDRLVDCGSKETRCNRHVVFFHGDIQVSPSGADVEDARPPGVQQDAEFQNKVLECWLGI